MTRKRFILLLSTLGYALKCAKRKPRKDLPLPVPFRLTSDGHACSGYLDVKQTNLIWKSAFSVCASSSWTIVHEKDVWIFKFTPTSTEKSCKIRAVRMHPVTPVEADSLCEVSGFESVDAAEASPNTPVLECMMQ